MADQIAYTLHGDDLQIVEVELDPGEAARGEIGTMMFMDDGIKMQTSTGGGIFKGLKRMFTGESFFISSFKNTSKKYKKWASALPIRAKSFPLI